MEVDNEKNEALRYRRQPAEVWSRVVGYLRPVSAYNPGKTSEYEDRKVFDVKDKKDD